MNIKGNIQQLEKNKCTGCGVCFNSCPNSAIKMFHTFEGFLYPYIDDDKCTMCGKCSELCPLYTDNTVKWSQRDYFAVRATDSIRWNSIGGGALIQFLQTIIENNGKVCIPLFSMDYKTVNHCIIDTCDELYRFCHIPYVQSNLPAVLNKLNDCVNEGNKAIFVGTPCESEAVRNFINSDNLIIIDMNCSGVSSANIWESYLDGILQDKSIFNVKQSPKELGLRETLQIHMNYDNNEMYEEFHTGKWISNYNKSIFCRKSCYDCKYDSEIINSDITLVNMWNESPHNDGKGSSVVLVNSERGRKFMKANIDKFVFCAKLTDPTMKAKVKKFLDIKPDIYEKRKSFFEMCEMYGFNRALQYLDNGSTKLEKPKNIVLDYHSGDNIKYTMTKANVWKEIKCDAYTMFVTNGEKWVRMHLPLQFELVNGLVYKYDIKAKIHTSIQTPIRFMLTKGEQDEKINILTSTSITDKWIRLTGECMCNTDGITHFMLASTDFIGDSSMICIEWIRIWEG